MLYIRLISGKTELYEHLFWETGVMREEFELLHLQLIIQLASQKLHYFSHFNNFPHIFPIPYSPYFLNTSSCYSPMDDL